MAHSPNHSPKLAELERKAIVERDSDALFELGMRPYEAVERAVNGVI